MTIPIYMPKYGHAQDEGTVVSWLKKVGESVEKGEALLELETDKATFDYEAPESGVLREIVAEDGAVVPVQSLIAVMTREPDEPYDLELLTDAGTTAQAAESASIDPAPTPPAPVASSGGTQVRSSPAAKKRAKDLGVDLATVAGSGPGGRVSVEDVEAAASPVQSENKNATEAGVPLSRMRQAIGRQMVKSWQEIPHFYLCIEIDMTDAETWRATAEPKPSVTDLLVKAAATALQEFSRLNARLDGTGGLVEHNQVNIGLAVGLDDGLLVPVIDRAETKRLPELAADRTRLVEAARKGHLAGSGKATFTVTNLGMFGITSFNAIVNPPECASLAVGALLPRVCPVGKTGETSVRQVMEVTLSADHRLADGMLAAKFLQALKQKLESVETIKQWM